MANSRPGQPQWQLSTPTRNQTGRLPQLPRTTGLAGAPFVDRPPMQPPTMPAAPTRHGDPRAPQRPVGPPSGEWRTLPHPRPPATPPPAPLKGGRRRNRRADANRWHWLLWIPILVPLMPAIYNHIEPTLFGVPFFYWGQLSFAFLATGVMTFVHHKVK
jgi:uncharacterized protein DUF3311